MPNVKLTKEEKLKKKEFDKMMKDHKNAIMHIAINASEDPWDGEFGLQMFVEHLKFMKDYYTLGYKVVAEEGNRKRSRLAGITEALEEYRLGYDIEDCIRNKYYNYDIAPEYELVEKEDKSFGKIYELKHAESYGEPRDGKTREEARKAYNAEIMKHRKKFYDIIAKELETWWD